MFDSILNKSSGDLARASPVNTISQQFNKLTNEVEVVLRYRLYSPLGMICSSYQELEQLAKLFVFQQSAQEHRSLTASARWLSKEFKALSYARP